jgi:hypothetical protein
MKDFKAIAIEMNQHAFDVIQEHIVLNWSHYVSRDELPELIKALNESDYSYDTTKMMAGHLTYMIEDEEEEAA